jgi:hypothetical protein
MGKTKILYSEPRGLAVYSPAVRLARTVDRKPVKCGELGRADERRSTPLAEIPSGVEKLLSQALINGTKTYASPPEQD